MVSAHNHPTSHRRWTAALLTALLAAACSTAPTPSNSSSSQDASHDAPNPALDAAQDAAQDVTPDSPPSPDAAQDATPDSDTPADDRIQLPSITQTVEQAFAINVQGRGSDAIGAINVQGNLAAVTRGDQTLQGWVYERQPWSDFSLTLYQTLLLSPDGLYMAWLYCDSGALTWIYLEGAAGVPLMNEPASGTCAERLETTRADVALGPLDMPTPTPRGGFEVNGAEVHLAPGQPGTANLGGRDWEVWVFEHVDCSAVCGSPGWHELHAVLRRAGDDPELGFAIFYLREDGAVQAYYGLALPSLERLPGRSFEATWAPNP